MDRSARNDALTGLVVLAVVAIFAANTGEIYIDPLDPGFSARDFPVGVLVVATLLALALLARAALTLARTGWRPRESAMLEPVLRYVTPLIALGFLYVWFLTMFQYILPTLIATVSALALFGNRGVARLAVAPFLATAVYYIVFYGIFGLYETPGTVWSYELQGHLRPLRRLFGLS